MVAEEQRGRGASSPLRDPLLALRAGKRDPLLALRAGKRIPCWRCGLANGSLAGAAGW